MRGRFLLALACLWICDCPAQQKSIGKFKSSGFMAMADLGIIVNSGVGLTARAIVGTQVNEHQSVGIGIGTDSYDSLSAMPIFVDIRAYFLGGDLKPFIFVEPGYALAWREHSDGNVGGLTVKGGAGLKAYIGTDFAFFVNVAFIYQSASRKNESFVYNGYYSYQENSETSTPYRSGILEVGFAF